MAGGGIGAMMRTKLIFSGVSFVLSFGLAAIASAQAPTTVQLPTFSFFTVNTSVSVPTVAGRIWAGCCAGGIPAACGGLRRFPGWRIEELEASEALER